jgi:hypothetical protein
MKTDFEITDLISLADASVIFGLSAGHINYLVRNNKLWGIKLGRNWFTTKKALDDYMKSNRKPGPKKI